MAKNAKTHSYTVIPEAKKLKLTGEEVKSLKDAEWENLQRRANIGEMSDLESEEEQEEQKVGPEKEFSDSEETEFDDERVEMEDERVELEDEMFLLNVNENMGSDGDKEEQEWETEEERTGVTHLVQCWHAQGHDKVSNQLSLSLLHAHFPQSPMIPSADLLKTAQGAGAVRVYYRATQRVAAQLAAMFKASFPQYYERYKKAFAAGVWYKEDKGPFLGRAVVWKLQVGLHQDGLDDGPALIFSCGQYKGGNLCLPQLDALLQ